jgi:hypothetical protein
VINVLSTWNCFEELKSTGSSKLAGDLILKKPKKLERF